MAIVEINNGTVAGDGTGSNLFDSFEIVNANFDELDDRTNIETNSYTSNGTLLSSESGNFIDNAGAVESVLLYLPTAVKGLGYVVTKVADYSFILHPGAAGFVGMPIYEYKQFDEVGAYMHIKCYRDGLWHIVASYGAISDE